MSTTVPAALPLGQYAEVLKEGYFKMALLAIKNHANKQQIRNNRKELVWRVYIMMMATMPKELLEVIACGNLALEKGRGGTVAAAIRYWEKRWDLQPGIYMLELVNKTTNVAPTPNQLKKILAIAVDYVECTDDNLALQIDLVKHKNANIADVRAGKRAYMENMAVHKPKFYDFMRNMEATWANFSPGEMDQPMQQPLREIGYGKQVRTRKKEHAAHRNSNFLMNLFEAICAAFSNQLGNDVFVMKFEVIYLMTEPSQCMLAEEMFDAIAQSNTDGGRGFCHADAGTTASRGATDPKFKWPAIQQDVVTNSPFVANMSEEMGRIEAMKEDERERNWLLEAIAYVDSVNIINNMGAKLPDNEARQLIGAKLVELWTIQDTNETLTELSMVFDKLDVLAADPEGEADGGF